MKNDNSTEQSNASKPMLANRLNAHECYKIKIEKKLTDKEYKNLLIENGIIIKKQIPEKLYFLDIDDTNCYPLSDRLNDAQQRTKMRDYRSFSQYLLKQNNNNQSQIKLLIVVAVITSAF